MVNGNAIFLGVWQNCTGCVWCQMAPRTRISSWLPKQAPHRHPSPSSLPLVLGKFSPGTPMTRPSTPKGCVGTLPAGYIRNVPLPRVPQVHSAQSHQAHKIPDYCEDQFVVPMYSSHCSIVERATFAFSPVWHAIAINKGDLSKTNHFITLQIDGQSPNFFSSNYITKNWKKWGIQWHHRLNTIQ